MAGKGPPEGAQGPGETERIERGLQGPGLIPIPNHPCPAPQPPTRCPGDRSTEEPYLSLARQHHLLGLQIGAGPVNPNTPGSGGAAICLQNCPLHCKEGETATQVRTGRSTSAPSNSPRPCRRQCGFKSPLGDLEGTWPGRKSNNKRANLQNCILLIE